MDSVCKQGALGLCAAEPKLQKGHGQGQVSPWWLCPRREQAQRHLPRSGVARLAEAVLLGYGVAGGPSQRNSGWGHRQRPRVPWKAGRHVGLWCEGSEEQTLEASRGVQRLLQSWLGDEDKDVAGRGDLGTFCLVPHCRRPQAWAGRTAETNTMLTQP